MNYSDTTSSLVINKLTKSQYETLRASGSLQSNQLYITDETLPSNLGDFNNDVGYVTASAVASTYATKGEVSVITASVSSLTSDVNVVTASVSTMASTVTALASSISAKRDYRDLSYVGYDEDEFYHGISNFVIDFPEWRTFNTIKSTFHPYSPEDPSGYPCWISTDYYVQFWSKNDVRLVAASNASTLVTFTVDQIAQGAISISDNGYNGTVTMNWEEDSIALTSQLSAYATASALGDVTASVSAMASTVEANTSAINVVTASVSTIQGSVDAMGSAVSAMESSVNGLASTVSAISSSMSAKRDYLDLTYSYSYTSTAPASTYQLYYPEQGNGSNEVNCGYVVPLGENDPIPAWGISALSVTFPSGWAEDFTTYASIWGINTPDGYAVVPSTYTYTWQEDDQNPGTWYWYPSGSITYTDDPSVSTWKDYFAKDTPAGAMTIDTQNYTTDDGQYLPDYGLNPVDGIVFSYYYLNWDEFEATGSSTISGTWDQGKGMYVVSASTFQLPVTWFDEQGTEKSGYATVTPVMPEVTISVVVSDSLALQGAVNVVTASVSSLQSSVGAMSSSISANTSAISAMASSISAVAGSLNVSGIGCSTITLSGTYSDSTSFAYNFVIQPNA